MQVSELSTKVFNFIGPNTFKITNDGKISVGDFLFSTEEYQEYSVKERLEITRAIETISPPLSFELKSQLIEQIQFVKSNLEDKITEATFQGYLPAELVLLSKDKCCDELIRVLEQTKIENISEATNSKIDKIPIRLSLRELAIFLYGLKQAKILDLDQGKLLALINRHFMYFNEREEEYKEINLNTLKKDFSNVKVGFGENFSRENPFEKTEEKIRLALEAINSINSLELKK